MVTETVADECWRPIPACDGYEITASGNVRTWLRRGNHREPRRDHPVAVSPVMIRRHLCVYLPSADRKFRPRRVNALAREVFGEPRS